MNKNIAFVVFGCLTLAGIVGTLFLLVQRPDATATFTAFVAETLALAVVAGGLGAGLNTLQQKVTEVHKQTNGTLPALRKENDRLTRENVALAKQLPPGERLDH